MVGVAISSVNRVSFIAFCMKKSPHFAGPASIFKHPSCLTPRRELPHGVHAYRSYTRMQHYQ